MQDASIGNEITRVLGNLMLGIYGCSCSPGLQKMWFVRLLQPQTQDLLLFILQKWRKYAATDDALCLQAIVSGTAEGRE